MGLGGLLSRAPCSFDSQLPRSLLGKVDCLTSAKPGQVLRRGLSALVTQQIADPSQRQALTVKLQRVGMSQAMAVDALCDVCSTGQTREQVAHVVLAHLAAVECADQRLAIRDAELSPSFDPSKDDCSSAWINSYHPMQIAFAMLDANRPRIEINVLGTQCEHL